MAKQKTKLRVAVVGRNIRAALTCWELSEHPQIDLTWLPTPSDLDQRDFPEWFIYPQGKTDEVENSGTLGFELRDLKIFFNPHRAIEISQIPLSLDSSPVHNIHPAVWRKIVSLGLWNDPSPGVWKKTPGGGKIPNPDWIGENSLSLSQFPQFKMRLLEGRATLNLLRDVLSENGKISFGKPGQSVQGIQFSKNNDGHRLVYNAPFGIEEFDRVTWMSLVGQIPNDEGLALEKLSTQSRLGFWKTGGTWVSSNEVSSLPPFSIWIQPSPSSDFLSTGLFANGIIKRVFAIPSNLQGGDPDRVWLQVQEFKLEESLDSLQIKKASTSEEKFSLEFLFEYCPYLKHSKGLKDWVELPLRDDNIILSDPKFSMQELKRGFLRAIPGPLAHKKGFSNPIRDGLRIPRIKSENESGDLDAKPPTTQP